MGREERFFPPRVRRGALPRAGVNAILDAARAQGGHWVYIGAPGGFGKSLAVSQWLAPQRNKFAWITLDPYDNNESRFVRKFLGGLAFAQRANRKLDQAAKQVRAPFLEYLFDALDLLLPNDKKYSLVLDDFHHLNPGTVLQAFPLIRNRLPSGFTVCILSREEPSDVFLDAILKGEMSVLRARDLVFNEEELCRLLSRNGLSPSQAPGLLKRTAGWPIAVGAFLMGTGMGKDFPDEAPRGEEWLYRYLDLHVWGRWETAVQDFLMRASLPDRLDEQLCRRLTGRADSGAMLEALSRNLAFVSRLGDGRYRLHDLFRDFLSGKLAERLGTAEIQALNTKVADALFEEGDYYAAAARYVRGSDSEGLSACCAAFRKIAVSTSVEDRIAFFRDHVIGCGQELFEDNPAVLAQCAFVHYLEGDARQFLRLLSQLRAHLKNNPDKKLDGDTFQLFLALQALDFRKTLDRYVDALLEERHDLESLVPGGQIRLGTFTAAMPLLHRGLREHSDLARGAGLDAQLSKRQRALSPFLGEEHTVILECLRSGILYECNRLSEACDSALKVQKMMDSAPCRAEVRLSANLLLAAILRGMGRTDEAARVERETERQVKKEGLLPLSPTLRAWQYAARIAAGSASAAREWLDVYAAPLTGSLPLYKMFQHFVTARALLAAREDTLAVLFGTRLLKVGLRFRRRLDTIEALLLLSAAHRNLGGRKKSLHCMERALRIAALCGFSRPFINDAPLLAPILDTLLRNRKTHKAPWIPFAVQVQAAMAGTTTATATGTGTKTLTLSRAEVNAPAAEKTPLPALSARQTRILELLERNASYREIAEDLAVAHSTAKYHVLKLYRTLGVSGAAEALARARRR